MSSRLRKLSLAGPALLAVFALGACGGSHTKVTTGTYAGESGKNAPYLNVGPLIYEVQQSRELNPFSEEDSAYLRGLTPAQRELAPGQEWFGVFLQVYNNTSLPLPAAQNVTITDTQGNSYTQVVPLGTNEFVYRGGVVPAKGRLPVPDSVAASGATQGVLLLFKIAIPSLDNRPIELRVVDPRNALLAASAELDV